MKNNLFLQSSSGLFPMQFFQSDPCQKLEFPNLIFPEDILWLYSWEYALKLTCFLKLLEVYDSMNIKSQEI